MSKGSGDWLALRRARENVAPPMRASFVAMPERAQKDEVTNAQDAPLG
jgi:hypothetical protein